MRSFQHVFVAALAFVFACAEAAPEKMTENGNLIVAEGTFIDLALDDCGINVIYLDPAGQLEQSRATCSNICTCGEQTDAQTTFAKIPEHGDQFRLIKTGENAYSFEIAPRAEDAEPPERL